MEGTTKHIDAELAKQGLQLTKEGKRFFEAFVLCGKYCKVPDHFLEKI